jgi:acetyl-CoA carboxylase biotin carboxyl carrier protein
MALLHSDVRKILDILEHAKHLDHLEITIGDYVLKAGKTQPLEPTVVAKQLSTDTNHAPSPVEPHTVAAKRTKQKPQEVPDGMFALHAPMAGTFYLTPSPNEPAFVKVGDTVAKGDTLCLVEVMKMFNSVPAPLDGTVHQIVATHGQTVAMGETILILDPEAAL